MLRTYKLGEADRIIIMLTRNYGQVRAVAKGVRRTTSRFGARLEPFTVIDVQLHKGKNLDTVTQVETISSHGELLAADYDLYASAHVLVETAERLTADEEESAQSHFLLLLGALHALSHRHHDPSLIITSYMLRALAISGWAPSVTACASCGTSGPHSAFSIPEGGMMCENCRPVGASAPAPDTVSLMGDLLSGDWAAADVSEYYARHEGGALVSSYLQWHLERRLQSLRVLENSRGVYP